jgi:Tfp pilus assembly protein PilE
MRIPRVRFTIRFLMIVVAVVGVFLTVARLIYFRRHYEVIAAMHASKEATYVRQAQGYERRHDWCAQQATIANDRSASVEGSGWKRLATSSGAIAHDLRRLAVHEARLKRTYERAARYPWLPVEPDPKEEKGERGYP